MGDSGVQGKRCAACEQVKPASAFHKGAYKSAANPLGLRPQCIDCASARRKELRASGGCREWDRRSNIRRHGISPQQYDKMLVAQRGLCAACQEEPEDGTNLAIHHDHRCCDRTFSCGKCVRALLCHGCNLAFGHLRDDPRKALKLAAFAAGELSADQI